MTSELPTISMYCNDDILNEPIDYLICPSYQDRARFYEPPTDQANICHFKNVLMYEDFKGALGETLLVHSFYKSTSSAKIKAFMFVGLGKYEDINEARFNDALKKAFDILAKKSLNYIGIYFTKNLTTDDEAILGASINSFCAAEYRFDHYKTSIEEPRQQHTLKIFTEHSVSLAPKFKYLLAEQTGIHLAKNLANMPANICTPEYLAAECKSLDIQFQSISTTIIEEQSLLELNMNSYLAVNRASSYPASMPVIHYSGTDADTAPIVLIGKGVTFDTGGITLKGAAGMQAMIYDMAGAAAVLGVMHSIAKLQLKINVVAILATAENCIDGDAYRPGDVLTSMSGMTIEVISTDAEGRLLLCDAITFAKRFKPKCIIDIATLTGAAITSLGHHASGLMSNNDELSSAIIDAGKARYDRVWAFPIWDEYAGTLDSEAADMKNAGSNSPGMITAACFLSKFAQNSAWAHLDIAGTSFLYGKQNTATGRPVPLLLKLVESYSSKEK